LKEASKHQVINNKFLKTAVYLIHSLTKIKVKFIRYATNLPGAKRLAMLVTFSNILQHCLISVKNAFTVLFLICFSAYIAQVNSPDLRCLKVNTNGDVVLTWAIPSDPANQFNAYVIYSATFKAGPFLPVDSINTYSVNTYTHVGASANTQSKYYFIRTKFINGGLKFSANKDTLRSIWLGLLVLSGSKDLKLQYNHLREPKLSTSSSFTISKEYPPGTWTTLRILDESTYADTISVCTASLNYQIKMNDFLGCVSESNISGGPFSDTKSPEEPEIDSISVLPNGHTVLAWKIPIDKDIIKYEIQFRTPVGTNSVLGVVNGRSNTLYTYTTTAATLTNISLYVGAIDSCKRGSTLNYALTTMFLQAKYLTCDYKTELAWNAYQSMPRGIKEYQVYYSNDGNTFTKIATTTLTAFTHTAVSPNRLVTYFVRVINKDNSITSTSNRVTFESYLTKIPDYIYIPSVSVINKSTVQIKIFIDPSKEIKGIDILRSDNGAAYKNIHYLPYFGSKNFVYEDNTAEPSKINYFYKLQLRDSCGNIRTISNTCKTILLKVSDDENHIYTKHLLWNEYEGFAAGVDFYKIYRVVNDVVEASAIGSTNDSITKFSDNVEFISDRGSKIEYYVEAVESGIGNPYGLLEKSRSNLAEVYMEDKIFIPSAFAPNGINTTWKPITSFIDKTDYLVRIFDRWGHEVFKTSSDAEAWDGGDFPNDIYVYLISYKNARGEYKEAKGTVLLMK